MMDGQDKGIESINLFVERHAPADKRAEFMSELNQLLCGAPIGSNRAGHADARPAEVLFFNEIAAAALTGREVVDAYRKTFPEFARGARWIKHHYAESRSDFMGHYNPDDPEHPTVQVALAIGNAQGSAARWMITKSRERRKTAWDDFECALHGIAESARRESVYLSRRKCKVTCSCACHGMTKPDRDAEHATLHEAARILQREADDIDTVTNRVDLGKAAQLCRGLAGIP